MLEAMVMRMRCRRVARVLQSYLDGEVDPPTATAVSEHLEECRRCGLEVSAYTAIKTAIAARGAAHVPDVDPAALVRLTAFARSLAGGDAVGGNA
jgi:anti-sigma factor RsiW